MRFIAGARCPACGVVDRIQVGPVSTEEQETEAAGVLRRRCIACGFEDTIDQLGAVSEPANRFVQPKPPPTQTVRLVDPSRDGDT